MTQIDDKPMIVGESDLDRTPEFETDGLTERILTAPVRGVGGKVEMFNTDCISGMAEQLAPESIDLLVTSIPFGALFAYSAKTEDVGNCSDGIDMRSGQFGLHLRFWAEQVLRVMKPGTLTCIHVQQLITYAVQHGYQGRRDFRGAVIDIMSAAGFHFHAEISIPKNPQAIAQRQKLHSLLFITGMRDARKLAPAVNDFVLIFKKPGEATPVPALFDAQRNPQGWITREQWIRWARGTWADIQETDVLDGYRSAREEDDERHVCVLQLDVPRRLIQLYTNPGELVFDPFGGIGTTGYCAVELGRDAVMFELKESYFKQMQANIAKARAEFQNTAEPAADLFSSAGILV